MDRYIRQGSHPTRSRVSSTHQTIGGNAMKRLILLSLLVLSFHTQARDVPYPAAANAKADVRKALEQAKANHRPVLIFFGANWCEDCRALADSLKQPQNAALMANDFNVVKVNVGNFDHNLDLAKRFGDPIGNGIPAAVLVSPGLKIVYSTKAGELSNARRMSAAGVHDFFEQALVTAGQ